MAAKSDADLRYLLVMFDEADKNKDGSISVKEAKSFLRNQGYYDKDQQKQFFHDFDKDHDDKVSREEFIACMHRLSRTAHTTAKIRKTFTAMDKNKDGRLDRREIRALFEDIKKTTLTKEQVNNIMSRVDQNKDGYVDYDEMLDLFIKQGLI